MNFIKAALLSVLLPVLLVISPYITSCGSGELWISYDDNVEVTTLAGTGDVGSTDGPGDEAEFNGPDGLTITDDDTIYLTDQDNHEIRQVDEDGTTTTVAGTGEAGYQDGDAADAQFDTPDGLVRDEDGNLYVGDSGNNVIRKITPGGVVSTYAGTGAAGNANGNAANAQFNFPTGVTMDSDGNLYVVDEGNNTIRKITPAGDVSTFAGTGAAGFQDGAATEAQFDKPHGIAVDSSDNIYITDQNNNRIRMVTPSGVVTTIAGNGQAGYLDGPAGSAMMDSPHGIGVNSDGEVFFADEENCSVRKINTNGRVSTYVGGRGCGFANGNERNAQFNQPRGLAVGWDKDVCICDYSNNRVRIIRETQN